MENIFGSNVKKLLLMFLISPYVLSESYSCTNELANAAWEKQVVFKRNGDDFIRLSLNTVGFLGIQIVYRTYSVPTNK